SPREAQPKNNIGEYLSDKDSIVSSKSLDPDSDLSSLLSELKSLKEQIKVLSSQTSLLYTELVKNALKLPNLSHPNSPIGPEENAEIYYQSNKIFDPNSILRISDCSPVTGSAANCKSNSELCESLGIANFKAAAKVSGSRFLYWLGKGLILEQALIQYTLKRAVEFGFSPVATPELVKSSIVEKCGFRPRTDSFENGEPSQIYTIENANDPDSESNGDPLCLIATSEIPLTAMYSEETLTCYDPNLNSTKNSPEYPHSQKTDNGTADQLIGNKQDPNCDSQHDIPNVKWFGNGKKFHDKYKTHLRDTNTLFSKSPKKQQVPIALVGLSHCYRSEAGSRGKDTSGLYRLHAFTKLELVILAPQDDSDAALDFIVSFERTLFEELGLSIRILNMPTFELGASAHKKFDVEAEFPARRSLFGEISSASNCTDFQSRRLGIRYIPCGSQNSRFVHTLNGTACAVPRIIAAILENFQSGDGSSVSIPKVLWPYTMGLTKLT
ncbi:Serine-tRNA ligase, mitochondrial, partial [Smittium mucronatum]